MKPRLRMPRALLFVLSTGALASTVTASCDDDDDCIPCLPDPRVGDAGTDGQPVVCPRCLPKDGVCGPGCVPDGFA